MTTDAAVQRKCPRCGTALTRYADRDGFCYPCYAIWPPEQSTLDDSALTLPELPECDTCGGILDGNGECWHCLDDALADATKDDLP